MYKIIFKKTADKKSQKTIRGFLLLISILFFFACSDPVSTESLELSNAVALFVTHDETIVLNNSDTFIVALPKNADTSSVSLTLRVSDGAMLKEIKKEDTTVLNLTSSSITKGFDFSTLDTKTFEVTAANGTTKKTYTVTVSTALPITPTGITAFAVNLATTGTGTTVTGTITGTSISLTLTSFPANPITEGTITTLTLSPGATASPANGEKLIFTNNTSSIVITAADGTTTQTYDITINITANNSIAVTTYTKTTTIGQAIKDPVLANTDTVISVSGLTNVEHAWTFGPTGGNKTAVAGILTLTKAELNTVLKDLADGSSTPFGLDISGTKTAELNIIYKPFEISSWQDLQAMRQNLAGDYLLMKDIEFADENNDGKGDYKFFPIRGTKVTTVQGFTFLHPDSYFTGSFDGQNFTITRLHIDISNTDAGVFQDDAGLFGYVASGGSVKNIGLINNFAKGVKFVGGLVGSNFGTVSGYTTGNVTGTKNIGGLVGRNAIGTASGYTTGNIIGVEHTGGLVGQNGGLVSQNAGGIASGYATGSITGTEKRTGGLVGFNSETVIGYATGTVTGSQQVGGLVGNNAGTTTGYATGQVMGTTDVGGLAGRNSSGIASATLILNGYWDLTSTAKTAAIGTNNGTDNSAGISSIDNVSYTANPEKYTDTGATPNIDVFINTEFKKYFALPKAEKTWPLLKTSFTIGTGADAKTIIFDFPQ